MLGDYGYVVVIEYNITTATPKTVTTTAVAEEESSTKSTSSTSDSHDDNNVKAFWVLYGHLDRKGIKKLQQRLGQHVAKGECIGYVGDIDDNGGWIAPHVHFQLSIVEPITQHDMPGAASIIDRNRALIQYPDPRYLLGPLY